MRFVTALSLLTCASAFTSHGSFVGRPLQVATTPASPTALSMNLFDRFTRVAKANLNNVLKNLEDPEKIMTQAVEDMQVSAAKC